MFKYLRTKMLYLCAGYAFAQNKICKSFRVSTFLLNNWQTPYKTYNRQKFYCHINIFLPGPTIKRKLFIVAEFFKYSLFSSFECIEIDVLNKSQSNDSANCE